MNNIVSQKAINKLNIIDEKKNQREMFDRCLENRICPVCSNSLNVEIIESEYGYWPMYNFTGKLKLGEIFKCSICNFVYEK